MRNGKASPTAPSPYGRGGIEELPSGRFRVRITVDGKRIKETCDTREAAETFRRALVQERHDLDRRKAAEPPPAPAVVTLASWGETWLNTRERQGLVRWPENDRSRWSVRVAPSALAAMPLVDIRTKHVRAWVDEQLAARVEGKPLASGSIRHALNLVRKCLGDACAEERIPANPALGVKAPKRTAKGAARDPWTFLTADEVRAVETCEAMPEAARLLFVVAIYTGLRAGELWCLRWGDVHERDARPEVIVRASWKGAPKNGRAQPVPLLPKAREALTRFRELATVDGEVPADDALVFPSPRGHQRQCGDDAGWGTRKVRGLHRDGLKLLAGITRPVRFHDLRHTCASHLVMGSWTSSAFPLADVRTFLRHGSVAMTERYAHIAPGHLHDRIAGGNASAPANPATSTSSSDASARAPVAPSTSSAEPSTASEAAPRGAADAVARVGHEAPPNSAHEGEGFRSKPLVSRARPGRLEPPTYGLDDRKASLENKGNRANVANPWPVRAPGEALRGVALDLLHAVDEGHPVAAPARALAVEALRSTAPDSAPWLLAVTVLEGGPLRARNAVELAGVVLDALGVGAVDEAAG